MERGLLERRQVGVVLVQAGGDVLGALVRERVSYGLLGDVLRASREAGVVVLRDQAVGQAVQGDLVAHVSSPFLKRLSCTSRA